MKKLLGLLIGVMLLCACNEGRVFLKKYTYVEKLREPSLFGSFSIKEKEEVVIEAESDSAAYLEAYKKFCISQKVYYDMKKKEMAEYLGVPVSFKLYNENGEDISSMTFASKTTQEKEISSEILSMNNIVGDSPVSDSQIEGRVDSSKIKELLPFFVVKKDDFDPNGKVWYTPKSAPKYVNQNGIYLYFAVQKGNPLTLRFRIQYHSDEWLFFKKVQFSIDGNAYEYVPMDTEHDSGNGGKIWEWFDEGLTGSDRSLIVALSSAKSAKMKFVGRQYYDIKTITKQQILDLKRTLELYYAMGGSY